MHALLVYPQYRLVPNGKTVPDFINISDGYIPYDRRGWVRGGGCVGGGEGDSNFHIFPLKSISP